MSQIWTKALMSQIVICTWLYLFDYKILFYKKWISLWNGTLYFLSVPLMKEIHHQKKCQVFASMNIWWVRRLIWECLASKSQHMVAVSGQWNQHAVHYRSITSICPPRSKCQLLVDKTCTILGNRFLPLEWMHFK